MPVGHTKMAIPCEIENAKLKLDYSLNVINLYDVLSDTYFKSIPVGIEIFYVVFIGILCIRTF